MRALVLSGGGVKGAFQLGVLSELYHKNATHRYDFVAGVSTGALTASMIAQSGSSAGQKNKLTETLDLYYAIKGNSSIVTGGSTKLSMLWNLLIKGGIMDPTPLAKLADKHVHENLIRTSGVALRVGYVDLEHGDYRTADETTPDIKKYVLASAYQPVFFQLPSVLADGGLRNMTPLAEAFEYAKSVSPTHPEPLTIDVIVTNPVRGLQYKRVDHKNSLELLKRTFEIIMHEMFMSDIGRAVKHNLRAPESSRKIKAKVNLYAPMDVLGDGLTFDPKAIRRMIDTGMEAQPYQDNLVILNAIEPLKGTQ